MGNAIKDAAGPHLDAKKSRIYDEISRLIKDCIWERGRLVALYFLFYGDSAPKIYSFQFEQPSFRALQSLCSIQSLVVNSA